VRRGATVAVVLSLLFAVGCARTSAPVATLGLEPLAGFDAAFAGARGHRRILALVSPN
jgi:hypothetical protein